MPPVARTIGLRPEKLEPSALALVGQHSRHPFAVLEQRQHRVLHVNVDALVDAVVLERADQFEPGAIADVSETWIFVAPKLRWRMRPSGVRSKTAPQASSSRTRSGASRACSSAMRQLLTYSPAAHGVGEVDAPIVPVIHICQRRRDAALGHDGVRFAEQRFANHSRDQHFPFAGSAPKIGGSFDLPPPRHEQDERQLEEDGRVQAGGRFSFQLGHGEIDFMPLQETLRGGLVRIVELQSQASENSADARAGARAGRRGEWWRERRAGAGRFTSERNRARDLAHPAEEGFGESEELAPGRGQSERAALE